MPKTDPALYRLMDALETLQAECAHLRATLILAQDSLLGKHPLPHAVVLERIAEVLGQPPNPSIQ